MAFPGFPIGSSDIVINQGDSFKLTGFITSTYQSYQGGNDAKKMPISAILAGNPVTISSVYPHRLTTGQKIYINGSNCTPSIDGVQTVTVLTNYAFVIVGLEVLVTQPTPTGDFAPILDITGAAFQGAVRSQEYLQAPVPNALATAKSSLMPLNTLLIEGQHDLKEGDKITVGTFVTASKILSIKRLSEYISDYSNDPSSLIILESAASGNFDRQSIVKVGENLATFAFTIDPTNGKWIASLLHTETRSIPVPIRVTPDSVGYYFYDVVMRLSGEVSTIMRGKVYINPELTQFNLP